MKTHDYDIKWYPDEPAFNDHIKNTNYVTKNCVMIINEMQNDEYGPLKKNESYP